jgi:hypothetical protein
MPLTTYVMVTEPIGPALGEAVRFRGAVSDGRRYDNHYRIVGGDRLMWAGRLTAWQANPRLFRHALTGAVRRIYPQLGRVNVDYLWSGTFGRTLHRMPQIGAVDRGVWVASGFGGHGLNTTALAGDLIARGIVEGDETWRLFAPYELVWAGGKFFRAVAQALYLGGRPMASFRAALSRHGERVRRRREARAQKRRGTSAPVPVPAGTAAEGEPAPRPQKKRQRGKKS